MKARVRGSAPESAQVRTQPQEQEEQEQWNKPEAVARRFVVLSLLLSRELVVSVFVLVEVAVVFAAEG
jgi:hypothetical protein